MGCKRKSKENQKKNKIGWADKSDARVSRMRRTRMKRKPDPHGKPDLQSRTYSLEIPVKFVLAANRPEVSGVSGPDNRRHD